MPHRYRWSLLAVVTVLAVWLGHPRAQVASSTIVGTGGTTFYGIGDLAGGGVDSIVQEATQVGSSVFAVGASTRTATNTPIAGLDTAVQWDSATNTLTVVPDFVVFPDPQPTSSNSVLYAITPEAQYIGGRVRHNLTNSGLSNGFRALRLLGGLKTIPGFAALDISDNANIVYGQQSGGPGAQVGVNNSRAIRSDVSGASTVTVQVPLLTPAGITPGGPCSSSAPTCLDNLPAYRGMSRDGSVLVGTAFTGGFTGLQTQYLTTNGLAFRWVSGEPAVVEIPRPSGGTWSSAIAISPSGHLTLAGGNSADFPLGEVWIQEWSLDPPYAPIGAIERLGSPNTQFSPRLYGGMTEDGAVVGVTFMGASPSQSPTFQNNPTQYAYLHNSFGWFHLANVLAEEGVDLWANGWDPANMMLTGIRSVDTDNDGTFDVELVFGQGRRRNANGSAGAPEGFVVSFPVGVLSGYQLPEAVPVENALVGAWALGTDPNNPRSVVVFMADGTFYTLSFFSVALGFPPATRFERGVYTLSAGNDLTLTTTEDRDGAGPPQSGTSPATFVYNGLTSSLNGRLGLSVNFTSADTFVIEDAGCTPLCSVVQATRIAGGSGSIAGGWTLDIDEPGVPDVVVLLESGKYFMVNDGETEEDHGIETGTYSWNPALNQLVFTEDFGTPDAMDSATLTQDQLQLIVEDDGYTFPLTRIVNPSTVAPEVTNETLAAGGAEDAAFSFTVTATHALTFAAEGLPTGLTIDPNTGVISGTSAVNGIFTVTITVTNSLGDTDTATLVLTFAPPPARLYAIGDLSGGGISSAVRDATRVNGTIYAVGSSTANHVPTPPATIPTPDTPVLWTSSGTGTGTLQALPYFTGATNTNTSGRLAWAITPNGDYIASQAKRADPSNTFEWVRVTRSLVPSSTANANLSLLPSAPGTDNLAMSDDGNVHYGLGWVNVTSGNRVPVRYQIDPLVGGVGYSYPDLAPTGKSSGFPIPRGTSSDGQIMVGAAFDGSFSHVTTPPTGLGTNTRAFRYTHTTGTLSGTTEVIPFLTDGTWNFPIALSSDGSVTVVAGNSTAYPGGEIYLTNGNNEVIDTLGSPNSGLVPRLLGGRTDDGVIAVTFANDAVGGLGTAALQGLGIPTGNRYSYFHNSRGWFHFSSALAAFGIDLVAQGWDPTNMAITSVRTVGGVDLVSGQGRRRTVNATLNGYVNGALEGFVAELPAGALAAFNPTPTPPADQSIVGTWYVGDPATTFIVLGFMADGTYVRITDSPAPTPRGFERGLYTWAGNAAGGALMITTLNDSDGVAGGAGRNGQLGTTAIISGDTFTFADTNTPNTTFILNTRIPMSPGSLAGGWVYGDAALPDQVAMGVFMPAPNLKYFFADDGPGGDYNLEAGTYTWDPVTHDLVSTPTVGSPDTTSATLSRDELGLSVVMTETDGDPVTIDFERIVAPSAVTPAFTGPLDPLGATTGVPFSFTVGTTLALTVTATGLPPGLAIDPNTGAITGTPTDVGTFNAQLTATNTFGATTNATLTIVVKSVQSPLIVVTPSNAIFGSTFTAATVGGSGLGAVSFAAAGACSNLAGGGDITMTSGTGTCVVTAAKAGDDAYYPTESTPVSVIAAQATSTTGLAAAPLSSSPGLPVTFTATVASQFGAAATGTVSFRRGGTTLGTAPVTSGVAQLTLTTLGVGTHVVSAIYAGDANVIGSTSSSVTISVVAPAAPTTTTLSSSLNPAIVGQTVTLTASVSSATAGTPTGSITFRQGTTVLATVPMSGAQATYSPNSLVQGSFGFTAVYSGDAQYIASTSATLVQQFNKASTTTTLTSTPNPSNGGQLVTFTATVSSAHPAGPTGSVTFRRGSTFLATVPVLGGSAVYATSALPSGSPQITAVYSGDIRYLTSTSAALTQQVNAGVTTTVLTISPSPSSNQQTVIFTATVTSSTGVIPTGLVTFKIGGTTIGMPVLLNASGVAVIGTSLPTGRYNGIRAQYEGDAYNGGSTSTTLSHIVQ